ncbi:MAG: hypothetical protein QME55_01665 [Brevundimonas sp.]|uniref:hypothetical protein n=1 Tax=Brevundimonas sp. TaxID=1871086 RepID=UPI002628090A|nr:hypothetical protein [Brevundimonas sp.]MDI6623411.1 hypothetical protein [Brevundimonas sp.]MDQ7811476.1 hypothetical protein [Brevundimonas sp.]
MEHYRLRKYRGPETWAQVRKAYVAGESAPSVARRFDVGLSNLRRRAMAEGWTRKRIAEQMDLKPVRGGADDPGPGLAPLAPPEDLPDLSGLDPEVSLALALNRATVLVGEGRATEARALAQAVEALERMWDAAAEREWRRASQAGERSDADR